MKTGLLLTMMECVVLGQSAWAGGAPSLPQPSATPAVLQRLSDGGQIKRQDWCPLFDSLPSPSPAPNPPKPRTA